MAKIKFTQKKPCGDRRHYINADDILVLLDRLPGDLWSRLRAVHFKDRSFGVRCLGSVTRGRREIAINALPPRVSLTRFLQRPTSPTVFGARRRTRWPELAIRRFMLYEVFLHEVGHLQIIDDSAKAERKFAREKKSQKFAEEWRAKLWDEYFDHADPVHNAPTDEELAELNA